MDLRLRGRTVLITGASSGIGRACAEAFAAEGARLGLLDRDVRGAELAAELSEIHGVAATFVHTDVTNETEVAAAVATVAAPAGLDAVVACAGVSGPFGKPLAQITVPEWDAVMAVNVRGPFLLVKHARRHLISANSPTVVLLGSDSGFVAAPGMLPYNASKGAVLQLTRALSVELAEYGVRVNCVCPSVVDTPMARRDLGIEPGGFADAPYPVQDPAQVASHVLYLTSPVSAAVNGVGLVSDFGYLCRSSFPA
ncbi:SDR family oxidoreductase [Nocardia panacis]|uniref:SDR family oxidoreductase n=2 Tax=Nocardia panacis TaxID=2340916 RepID=A0A3A4JW09_9NOCA|nr:SDR family oxidoreductase [Nocardia panacis]